jgi:catechol 2,3-dioxygenase-like lactoylglutathione lyase family enzyme
VRVGERLLKRGMIGDVGGEPGGAASPDGSSSLFGADDRCGVPTVGDEPVDNGAAEIPRTENEKARHGWKQNMNYGSISTDMEPTRIHHVGLPVSDLDRSIAWYRDALGLALDFTTQVPEGVAIAFMVAQTGERLELFGVDAQDAGWEGPIPALRAGVAHTGWTVDDLDAVYARAVEAGGRSVWSPRDSPEPGRRMAFVADPDGNLVELISR